MKIAKVLNNNGATYAIIVRFPTIQNAELVEVTYKRLLMKTLHSASILLSVSYSAYSSRIRFYSIFPYCSMKINKVLNNKEESYAIVVRFLTIWTAQSVELNTNGNAWKNYTMGIYYSEFHILHISQVYISIRTSPYCSIKITKVLSALSNCCSISKHGKCSIRRAYIEAKMDEIITLCEYTTQSFLFCTFVRYTFPSNFFQTVRQK